MKETKRSYGLSNRTKTDVLEIRTARARDFPEVRALFLSVLHALPYYNEMAKNEEAKKYSLSRLRKISKSDRRSILVAEEGGKMIGACFNSMDAGTVWMDWLCVREGYRGIGVGSALAGRLLEIAAERKAFKVWCDCRSENRPSKELLRKLGFRKIGEVTKHWYGQDYILWERGPTLT